MKVFVLSPADEQLFVCGKNKLKNVKNVEQTVSAEVSRALVLWWNLFPRHFLVQVVVQITFVTL